MDPLLILIIAQVTGFVIVAAAIIISRRRRMEQRARELLALHPQAARTSVYLPFNSIWPGRKKRQIEAKISEMAAEGWTFLRASEVSPLRSLRSWGGGINLEFIREQPRP